MITQAQLVKMIVYNPCTGLFVWKEAKKGRKKVAGCKNPRGYIQICIDYRLYQGHRLAWLYTYGEWPNEIDHLDGNPTNNSIWNLANGSHRDNMLNQRRFHR